MAILVIWLCPRVEAVAPNITERLDLARRIATGRRHPPNTKGGFGVRSVLRVAGDHIMLHFSPHLFCNATSRIIKCAA
jgi:hypothetical protein